jgi:Kef-type K+ transport system membrane component KefB
MTDVQILGDLGVVVVGAALILLVGRPFGIPPILSYMLAGLALGPLTGLLGPSESVDLFSELGIALLLFVVGLELSVEKVRAIGKTVVLAGTAQVVLTFGLGVGLAHIMGFPPSSSVVVGLMVAFSSTVVVVKLLDRAGELDALYGRLSVGVLLVQDVLVAVVLTLIGALAEGGGENGGTFHWGPAFALLGIMALALGGAAAGRWVLPRLVAWLRPVPEGLFIASLAWLFAFILGAELLHVSIELGAFMAGVVLAQLPYNEELRRRAHPLVDLFLAVFFVSLGTKLDLVSVSRVWPAAVALSVFVVTVKPTLVTILLGAMGQPSRVALLTGVTLGQTSEFGFILAGLALQAGLVPPDFLGLVSLTGFMTIGASAVLVPKAQALAPVLDGLGLLDRLPGTGRGEPHPAPPLEGHVVVIGMNTLGRILVQRFDELGEAVLAVDTDAEKLEGLPARTLTGDVSMPAVLKEAGIERAQLVVSALQIEDVNSLLAYRCRDLGVPVSVHAFDSSLVEDLMEIGTDHLMVSKLDGIVPLEAELRRLGVIA